MNDETSEHFTKTLQASTNPEKVEEALTNTENMRRWWENPVWGDPSPGGEIRFGFADSDERSAMQVEQADQDCVRWKVMEDTGYDGEWNGTTIEFRLQRMSDESTLIRFQHIGLTPELPSYEGCAVGWAYFLLNIVTLAETN